MNSSTQRLLAAAVLVLSGIGLWKLSDAVALHKKSETNERDRDAITSVPPRQAAAGQAIKRTVQLAEPAPKLDRYASCPVMAEKETVQEIAGVRQVKRLRLIRDASFKYPLIRVEDELVRGPLGDRLTRQLAMVGDHVLVKVTDAKMDETKLLDLLKDEGASIRKKMPASGLWLVAFAKPDLETVPRLVTRLSKMEGLVRYAEPDFIMKGNALPNDPSFTNQWNLHNTGQNSGEEDADVDAPEAWAITTGSRDVKVAVIDTGIDVEHPDLAANIWTNPHEIKDNGIDDDNNGYVDDIHGWDFANEDANPADDHNHGTHCAGIIGAVGNNGKGIAGVSWQVSMMALKFLNAHNEGTLGDAIEATQYATRAGVQFTSNSWTGPEYSALLKEAIDEAGEVGILAITAAGNNKSYTEYYPEYPASYSSRNIISVASTTHQDLLAETSNYGPVSTDLGAPGEAVYSTIPGGYISMSGTSMACPHVTGACVLLKATRPTLTHLEILDLILKSVDEVPALKGKTVTGGRLNIQNALLASNDVLVSPGSSFITSGPFAGPFSPVTQTYDLTNYTQQTLNWTATVDQPWVSLSTTGGALATSESVKLVVSLNTKANVLKAGSHFANVTLVNASTGRSQIRQVAVSVHSMPVYQFGLDTDPGWPRNGEWAYGTPLGGGGAGHGKPDPKSGKTGTKVFGINLAGNYSLTPGSPHYLTAGPFDLRGQFNARLRYQRWLNSDFQPWVHATVAVSADGSTWHSLWNNGNSQTKSEAWEQMEHALPSLTDDQPQVYIRWGHQVAVANALPYSGWNLDDVQILATPRQHLLLTAPETLTEGSAPVTARLTVSPAPLTNLTVTLTSDPLTAEFNLPHTVVIGAGMDEASFPISVLQDSLPTGSREVSLTATAPDYLPSTAVVIIDDADAQNMQLTLPARLREGQGELPNQATLTLASPAAANIIVRLKSSDTTELLVPAQVTVPKGKSSVPVLLTVPDDDFIDGAQTVTITATVTNWPQAQATVEITDNEDSILTLQLPEMRLESAGRLEDEGTVRVSGILTSPLTVLLASSDIGELVVPASVVIPAGSSSARFDLQMQDDEVMDGDQEVGVTATSAGFATGVATLVSSDSEVPALPFQPGPADGNNPTSPKTNLAWQYLPHSGAVPDSYDVYFGMVAQPVEKLGSTTSPAWSLLQPHLPANKTYYWRIVAKKGTATRTGPTWSFTTADVGNLHHFVWREHPATVGLDVPFPARVDAVDEYDNRLSLYEGSTLFKALIAQPETTTGSGTYPWAFPFHTSYQDARTQSIYTPTEAGPAGKITALALEVSVPPDQPLNVFTIRLKHTAKTDYQTHGNLWETEGWTTVHAGSQTLTAYGWTWFVFATPFDYDGTSNLMVDFSYNNEAFGQEGSTRTTILDNQFRTLAFRTDSHYGDPLQWSGTLPEAESYNAVPNLRFQRANQEVPLAPANSGAYTSASWIGQIKLQQSGEGIRLYAEDAEDAQINGLSEPIRVITIADFLLSPEPAFTGGTTNEIKGGTLGAGYEYEIQRATRPDFSDSASSGYLTTPAHVFTQLLDGRLYHYRGRARTQGALGRWSAVERSTQDASPPSLVFNQTTGGMTSLETLSLSGTSNDAASGIGSLTANATIVSSTDDFASWTAPALPLEEGRNSITFRVVDKAMPPNSKEVTWIVTRLSTPAEDADGDGVPDLLEYAFNSAGSASSKSLPTIAMAIHPETRKKHLILSYRRLILNPSNLVYTVETSTHMDTWQPLDTTSEVISTTPTGDGNTELVKLRLYPAIEGQERRFARLRVETSK